MLAVSLLMTGCEVKMQKEIEKVEPAPQTSSVPTPVQAKAIFLDGSEQPEFSLASYHGKVLVLDFWATWDAPSRAQMSAFNELSREWQAQNVAVVGMAVDRGDRDQIAGAVKSLNLSYPVVLADETVQKSFGGVRALPTRILVDKTGRIRKQIPGVVADSILRDEVRALVAEN